MKKMKTALISILLLFCIEVSLEHSIDNTNVKLEDKVPEENAIAMGLEENSGDKPTRSGKFLKSKLFTLGSLLQGMKHQYGNRRHDDPSYVVMHHTPQNIGPSLPSMPSLPTMPSCSISVTDDGGPGGIIQFPDGSQGPGIKIIFENNNYICRDV